MKLRPETRHALFWLVAIIATVRASPGDIKSAECAQ
jgi:hypothetical protein